MLTGSAITAAGRRDVVRAGQLAAAEEVFLHFLGQELARLGVGEDQAVFVDQAGLVLEPGLPGLLADLFVDALAERPGIWRAVEAFGFGAELDAADGSGHGDSS